MTAEKTAVAMVADLMILAARTAPKAKGVDTILTRVLTGEQIRNVADHLQESGKKRMIGFFIRDAKNLVSCDACVLFGARGDIVVGVNCGACGYSSCEHFTRNRSVQEKPSTDFSGPNCAIRMSDLGIALGSAVKTAQIHNVDNRIMYSVGAAAKRLGLLDSDLIIGIPLSAMGKNPYFDRP